MQKRIKKQKCMPCGKKNCLVAIILMILTGDYEPIRKIFRYKYKKGNFPNMLKRFTHEEVKMWEDDLCQEVYLVLKNFYDSNQIQDIKYQQYLINIVRNKSINEDKRLGRCKSLKNKE